MTLEEDIAENPAPEAPPDAAAPGPETPAETPAGEAAAPEPPAEEAPAPETPAEPDETERLKDRLLRLQADFDNYRKRQARDRADWIRQANADLIEALLPVLDQTDQALAALAPKAADEAAKPWLDGFEIVRKTFLQALEKFGAKPLESPVGKPLDPNSAEALSTLATGKAEPGTVVFEIRKGYELGGKVLRAAQVVVEADPDGAAAAPATAAETPAEEAPSPAPAGAGGEV